MNIESKHPKYLYNELFPPPSNTRGTLSSAYGTPDKY